MNDTATTSSTVIRRYSFKLYPNAGQKAALDEQRRMCGRLWNALLDQQERWYLLGELLPLAEIVRYQRVRAGQLDQHVLDRRKGRWEEVDGKETYVPGGERDWRKARIDEAKAAKRKRLSAFDQGKEITKLRRACPEFQQLPADTEARVADMLSEAFKGFFRRAKAGEASAGYPKFKSVDRFETIPFREMGRGWKLHVHTGLCESGSRERKAIEYRDMQAIPCGTPEFVGQTQAAALRTSRPLPCGTPEFEGQTQEHVSETGANPVCGTPEFQGQTHGGTLCTSPRGQAESPGKARNLVRPSKWRLYVKGVPGLIKVRGQLPRDPISWKNAEVIWRNENWWLSLVVEMSATRKPGEDDMNIVFDLVDQFARVERAEGAMSVPLEGAKRPEYHEDSRASDAAGLGLGSDDRLLDMLKICIIDAAGLGLGSDDRSSAGVSWARRDAAGLGLGSDDRLCELAIEPTADAAGLGLGSDDRTDPAGLGFGSGHISSLELMLGFRRLALIERRLDELKSERDQRFTRFSYRWRSSTRRIARLTSYAARYRGNLLHAWTTSLVREASSLRVTAPTVKEATATARGDRKRHGAAVRTVAELNRHVLNQAPGSAIQMLTYKSAEAGIPFVLVKDESPAVAVGHELSEATKANRRLRRAIKRNEELCLTP